MRGLIFFHRGLGRVEYQKDWLSVEQQIERLRSRGLTIDDDSQAARLLNSIGYYRLTGYLYPFLETEARVDFDGRRQITVLPKYREGTRLNDAIELVDFDRSLRLAVLDGVERIEIAAKMRIGHEIGRHGPFTHENPDYFDHPSLSQEPTAVNRPLVKTSSGSPGSKNAGMGPMRGLSHTFETNTTIECQFGLSPRSSSWDNYPDCTKACPKQMPKLLRFSLVSPTRNSWQAGLAR